MSFGFYPSYYKKAVCSSRKVSDLSERHYLCVECDKEFVLHASLTRHVFAHHKAGSRKEDNPANSPEGSNQEPLPENTCPLCSLSIGRVSLKRHMMTEHNAVPYLCTRCNSRFSQYEGLVCHKLLCWRRKSSFILPKKSRRLLIERISCEICSLSLCNEASLFSHMNSVHNPTFTSLACCICSKEFLRSSHLASHFKIHKNVMKCGTCGIQCYSPEQLMQHTSCCGLSAQESREACPQQKPVSEPDLTYT